MFDWRPILLVLGTLLTMLGLAMFVPVLFDLAAQHSDWQAFLVSAFITLFVGVTLWLSNSGEVQSLNLQQAFLVTTLAWVVLAVFAALPFTLGGLSLGYTDALFEAMSGLTTTGATVIVGLDGAAPGILIWRALLQWMGGIGIIVMAITVLPMLQVGGMQLFRLESSDTSEKILPRATQIAGSITGLYLAISGACALAYLMAGMSPFEALAHAMTTISTGGFSTSDNSIGHFDSTTIDYVATIFMIAGSLPFVLYLQVMRGNMRPLLADSQVRWFLAFVVALIFALTVYQMVTGIHSGWSALRYAAFNVVSIMTGTGYATTNYGLWGGYALIAFFFIMFIGGCAGSTSCGIKVFRFQVIYASISTNLKQLLQPHGVFVPHYNRRPLTPNATASVMSFIFLFFVCFALLSLALGLLGLDHITALSAAASAIANVGPGLGHVVGPSGTYGPLPDTAKWLLAGGMLLGRLELFTVLVLFSRRFWRH